MGSISPCLKMKYTMHVVLQELLVKLPWLCLCAVSGDVACTNIIFCPLKESSVKYKHTRRHISTTNTSLRVECKIEVIDSIDSKPACCFPSCTVGIGSLGTPSENLQSFA